MNVALIGVHTGTKEAELEQQISRQLRALRSEFKDQLHILIPDNEWGKTVLKVMRDFHISHQVVYKDDWMKSNSLAMIALSIRTKVVQLADMLVIMNPNRLGPRQYIECAKGLHKPVRLIK